MSAHLVPHRNAAVSEADGVWTRLGRTSKDGAGKRPRLRVNCGESAGNRTLNLVIKSHLLCQLSYAPSDYALVYAIRAFTVKERGCQRAGTRAVTSRMRVLVSR